MSDALLSLKMIENVFKELSKGYNTKEEFLNELDTLQYALFFLDKEIFTYQEKQDMAFLVQRIKVGVKEAEDSSAKP